jgi:hypothetical protein
MRAAALPDIHSLRYLVFDGRKLVAAFARRDDAGQWIEEIGHPTMELREVSKQGRVARPDAGGR